MRTSSFPSSVPEQFLSVLFLLEVPCSDISWVTDLWWPMRINAHRGIVTDHLLSLGETVEYCPGHPCGSAQAQPFLIKSSQRLNLNVSNIGVSFWWMTDIMMSQERMVLQMTTGERMNHLKATEQLQILQITNQQIDLKKKIKRLKD